MPIIREFRCADCGTTFESMLTIGEVSCPQCSAPEPERVFLTPPGITSPQTSSTDKTLKSLAADYGLTDMSNRNGAAVRQAPSGPNAAQFASSDAQTMQVLGKLGGNADGFSPVLPSIKGLGGPAPSWAARDSRNKSVR